MKFVTGAVLTFGVIYLTFASVLPENHESLRRKRYLPDYEHSLRPNVPYQSINDDVIVDKANINTLKLVQVIFRHGDRTPIDRFPKDPYDSRDYWPEGWGKLTDRGKQMQFKLGQYIRRRYDGFIGKKYRPEEIYVQSSDKDRTIMSAMANLAGMWPPTGDLKLGEGGRQQFVPVHTISIPADNKIAFTKACPSYDLAVAEVKKYPTEVDFNDKQADLYKYLSEHTGLNVISYDNVSDIYDTLFVQSCHNLTLPQWALKDSLFPDKLRVSAERWLLGKTFTSQMRHLRAGPIMTEFLNNMKRAKDQPSESTLAALEAIYGTPAAKMYLYSGHDTTLSAILAALGLFDGKIPPYASSLYFELHEESGTHFVKVFYRPNLQAPAEELKLKYCSSKPCEFKDFVKSLQYYIMDDKDWEKLCSVERK